MGWFWTPLAFIIWTKTVAVTVGGPKKKKSYMFETMKVRN